MSDLRAAAQQALEAYEKSQRWPFGVRPDREFAALSAALAEPIVTSDYPNSHQRKPLTDEMLDCLWRETMSEDWEHREFAREIERAHGIGGAA